MRKIAESNKGGYYYIENVKKVSEWLILSVSGLMCVLGENAIANLKIMDKNHFKFANFFVDENDLEEKKKGEQYILSIPHLIFGENKDFVFELEYFNNN
jgi:hypothetical protein